jgi:phosphonate transport system substrate-binding protein
MSLQLRATRFILKLTLILIAMIMLSACGQQADYPFVRFSQVEPVTKTQPTQVAVLRVALATGLSPSESLARYRVITDYLSAKLGGPVELLQRKTYANVDDLLREGKADIAFVCSSSYVMGRESFGERFVAAPVIRGTPYYNSVIIVNASSSITSFADLQGKSVALTDPQSTSGTLYIYSQVVALGGLSYFKGHTYTYSHDYSINAVRDGLVDAAAVDSNVLAGAMSRDPKLSNLLRIIDTSPSYANNPVVASPSLDAEFLSQVQSLLLGMDSDPEGRQALATAGIDRFVNLGDDQYNSVRQLIQNARVNR